jgi:hypothetical protein
MEFIYKILGYRKPGMKIGASSNSIIFSDVPRRKLRGGDWIDLSPNYHKDQGRVGACACVTIISLIEDIVISETKNNLFEIPWKPVWKHMKELRLADDNKGSYLLDNLWYGQNIGYEARDGSRYIIDKVERVDNDEVEYFIRMGYQIYTGATCGSPMCDKNWLFRLGQRIFKHSFRVIGLNFLDKLNKRYLCETTWWRYGLKKASQFFFPFGQERKLMSKYVITVKKV